MHVFVISIFATSFSNNSGKHRTETFRNLLTRNSEENTHTKISTLYKTSYTTMNRIISLIAFLTIGSTYAIAQVTNIQPFITYAEKHGLSMPYGDGIEENVLIKEPEFPGGPEMLTLYLRTNAPHSLIDYYTKTYPSDKRLPIVVSFFVETDGTLSDIRIIRGPQWIKNPERENIKNFMHF